MSRSIRARTASAPRSVGVAALVAFLALTTVVLPPRVLASWWAVADDGFSARLRPDVSVLGATCGIWFAASMLLSVATLLSAGSTLRRPRSVGRCLARIGAAAATWAAMTSAATLLLLAVY